MRLSSPLLGLVAVVHAHSYVRNIEIDNALWPGYDVHQDANRDVKRIVFPFDAKVFGLSPVYETDSPMVACNNVTGTPQAIAPARAGSNITFQWSPWIINHRGPILTYMAPYNGSIDAVDVNRLNFFKIAESGLQPDKKSWATDVMVGNDNRTSAVIPWDIKPGKYVVRHEVIALHFATDDNEFAVRAQDVNPQYFVMCLNAEISGHGSTVPEGVRFPGAYKRTDPGINFNLYKNKTDYIIPGPPLYTPEGSAPTLIPLPRKVISPTGSTEGDREYAEALRQDREKFDPIANSLNENFPTVFDANGEGNFPGFPGENGTAQGSTGVAAPLPPPLCSQEIMFPAIVASGCAFTDAACICGNEGFKEGYKSVYAKGCTSPKDKAAFQVFLNNQCTGQPGYPVEL